MNNLIVRPESAVTHIARLQQLMKQWQAKVDTLPVPARTKPTKSTLTGLARLPDQWQPDWIVKKYF